MNKKHSPRDPLSTVRIRIILKEEDVGLEPLFFHLQGLHAPIARSNFVRALLVPPAAIDQELLEVLRQTPLDKEVGESVTVEISISARDAGLTKTLQELNAVPGIVKQRVYIKRRLLFLFAANGIGTNAALLIQCAQQQAGRQDGAVTVTAPVGLSGQLPLMPMGAEQFAAPAKSTPAALNDNQVGAASYQAQPPTAINTPAFDSNNIVMNFSPINTKSEDVVETKAPIDPNLKARKFKENAGFFGSVKR